MEAITPTEADQIIENHLSPLVAERVPFLEAFGRILREPVLADRDFPPFDRVMMDGIAIRFADLESRKFICEGIQRAGVPAQVLHRKGGCFEVMTGAVLPTGADTVIPIEELVETTEGFVLNEEYQTRQGQFVHRRGSDNRAGDRLLSAGQLLSAKAIALIATCGYAELEVNSIPRITLVSTGDELVEVNQTPGPFQIRKSNVYALKAACQALPTPVDVRVDHLPDDRAIIAGRLAAFMEESDLVLFSGGISKGKYDFLQELLAEAGATKHFQWVKQRPGKPLWFGTAANGSALFALPGNPNSTLTCFYRYVVKSIHILAGLDKLVPESAALKVAYHFNAPLTLFLPVISSRNDSGTLKVEPLPTQNSGDLAGLALSDGFIELPANRNEFPVGFKAPFYSW